MKTLDCFINNPKLIDETLENAKEYRAHDKGWDYYRQVLKETNVSAKFSREFISLVYSTLRKWNMDNRGAQLAEWECFVQSIQQYEKEIVRLSNLRLETVSESQLQQALDGPINRMFHGMQLMQSSPRLVAYSKTFHFLLPNLFVPIDRNYTLDFFYGNGNVGSSINAQFRRFSELHQEFRRFASCVPLADMVDEKLSPNIPKVIDNILIGYKSLPTATNR